MENTALILISIMIFLLVIILGVMSFLIYKLLQQKLPTQNSVAPTQAEPQYHPAILERMKEIERLKPKRSELFCPNHPEEPGETMCAICDKLFCKACIRPYKSLHFCKEHLPLIMRNEWEEVFTLKTSTHDPEEGVRLYDAKKILFEEKNVATYVETHYKINVDQDYIETYLVVYSMPENVTLVKDRLEHP